MINKDIFQSQTKTGWLAELAESIQLREGVDGITRALWILYSKPLRSTREWSSELQIPVPVLAALRRELEKKKILHDKKHIQITEIGVQFLETLFGKQETIDQTCPSCQGSGLVILPEAFSLIDEFSRICEQRPSVDVALDQSHATPDTGIRKAMLLLEKGLLGRSLLFMGDDDLISIACWLVRKKFIEKGTVSGQLSVADVDKRYLELIHDVSGGEIETIEYDVREEIPEDKHQQYDAVLTDPAYTVNGITLFSYRCAQALKKGGSMWLSMPFPDNKALHDIQSNLLQMGLVIRKIYFGFNHYLGASMHAGQTNLVHVENVYVPPPEKYSHLRYTPFYTGEVRRPGGMYECTRCHTRYPVGPDREFLTIQELKQAGCSECGHDTFCKLSTVEARNNMQNNDSSESSS